MVRDTSASTIISYHSADEESTTSAKDLDASVRFLGDSVYFLIFKNSLDPTLVLLAILWHALYS
jgi:hypothetical protein